MSWIYSYIFQFEVQIKVCLFVYLYGQMQITFFLFYSYGLAGSPVAKSSPKPTKHDDENCDTVDGLSMYYIPVLFTFVILETLW